MITSRKIFDAADIDKSLTRIAHEILERNKEGTPALVGLRTCGEYLASRLASRIADITKQKVRLGVLDINLYRDDLTRVQEQPVIRETEINFDINDNVIVLVDDVLYTGRTVRCALDALIDFGRPKAIQLAVLVDRGHRELPIKADYVGKNIPTSLEEKVTVHLTERDGKDEVIVERRN